jgi:hypothetical protein
MLFLIELCLTALIVMLAIAVPRLAAGWFATWENRFSHMARSPRLAVVIVGALALILRAALLPVEPIPKPGVQDEFSYLLAADTFAHGRLANPMHPMWAHLETIAVLQRPTYASKYPPAQGLLLAAGQVIFGHPFWGVWLSVGIMCAGICWMLQGWLTPGWAFLGGVLAAIRLGTFSYWASSYWGGAVAAVGGALVLGAVPRIKQSQRVRDALLMGLGLAILANSRPYEGLVFCLPIMVAMAVWTVRNSRGQWVTIAERVILPIGLILILTGFAMGYYSWRVTGTPFRFPYQVYQSTYDPTPLLLWQSPGVPPLLHYPMMESLAANRAAQFIAYRSFTSIMSAAGAKAIVLWLFFSGTVFLPIIVFALAVTPYGFSWKDLNRNTRFLIIVATTVFVGLVLEVYCFNHYAAPITCVIYALLLTAMRYVRQWEWRGNPTGLAMVRAVPVICVILLVVRAAMPAFALTHGLTPTWCTVDKLDGPKLERARLQAELENRNQPQLVLVQYSPGHNFNNEWVYNSADIDGAKVLWARDMGVPENEELVRYFSNRQVWLVNADEANPRLSLYSPARTLNVTAWKSARPALNSVSKGD